MEGYRELKNWDDIRATRSVSVTRKGSKDAAGRLPSSTHWTEYTGTSLVFVGVQGSQMKISEGNFSTARQVFQFWTLDAEAWTTTTSVSEIGGINPEVFHKMPRTFADKQVRITVEVVE